MLLLYVTSPNIADARECLALLNAWRSLLRIKSRSCDLLNLALLRLDGVFVLGIDRLIELSPSAAQAWGQRQGMKPFCHSFRVLRFSMIIRNHGF